MQINISQVERGALHVHLSDMGLAKIKVGCSKMTHVQILGTLCYAAPEIFEGTAGKPSDVWGFHLELCGRKRVFATTVIYKLLLKKCLINFQNQQICPTHDP